MADRYANLDSFTKSYPGPRGGSVCFLPGEVRTGHWWSRFANGGGLKKVPPDYNPSRDFKAFGPKKGQPVVSPRIVGETTRVNSGCSNRCDSSCQIACENKCELSCENTKQSIKIFDNHEKVGSNFYCRHCDWSTQDLKRVDAHMEAYHPDVLQAGPAAVVDSGISRSDGQAKDPGTEANTSQTDDRAVPARSSPPPRTPKKKENVQENKYWEIVDGMFHCLKCQSEMAVNWTTPQRSAMSRHAKLHHGYEKEGSHKKKKKRKKAGVQ